MNLRSYLSIFVALGILAHSGHAQAASAADPVGVWRGTSTCQVRPSACHDEIVVYRITRAKASDSVSMDAFKIINGQEDDMGTLACHVAALGASFTCAIPNAVWHFTIRGDSLIGDLRRSDSTRFRDVRAARSR
jgi:hypothetical protein